MYKYVTLYDKGDFAGVIKIKDPTVLRLQYWDYPVIPIGINLIPWILKIGRRRWKNSSGCTQRESAIASLWDEESQAQSKVCS